MMLFLPSPQKKTKCLLYSLEFSILDTLAKLQEVATTFVMFSIRPSVSPSFRLYVHPSVSMKYLHFLLTNFCEVLCRRVLLKYAEKLPVFFKSAILSSTEHKHLK